MLKSILPEIPPSVNTPTRLRVVLHNARPHFVSVPRTCGHTDLIPVDDNRADMTALEWASRDDVACAACRHQADPAASVPTLIGKPYAETRGGGGSGGHGGKRPSEHKGRRKQQPGRKRQAEEAWAVYFAADRFLAEAALGLHGDCPEAIKTAQDWLDQSKHKLRKLGAIL